MLLPPLRIEIKAVRYALAIQTLRRAKRSWHRLDAALVYAGNCGTGESELEIAWQALTDMDQELDRLVKLLT
jgi:hypothetical protein